MVRYIGLQSFLVMANGLSIASCQHMKVMYSLSYTVVMEPNLT